MPRPSKGKHTCAENAGLKNFDDAKLAKFQADDLTQSVMAKTRILLDNRIEYKGKWTDEEFEQSVNEFFETCEEINLEPSRPALIVWLNVSDGQFSRWLREEKYCVKYKVLNRAMKIMEMVYHAKLDNKPVPQMFKLKTQYNYVENQKVEITSDTKVSADEVADKIKQMGLK